MHPWELKGFSDKLYNINECCFDLQGMDIDQYIATLDKEDGTFLKLHRAFVTRVLQLQPGIQAVIGNGKVWMFIFFLIFFSFFFLLWLIKIVSVADYKELLKFCFHSFVSKVWSRFYFHDGVISFLSFLDSFHLFLQVIGPLGPDELFIQEDFSLLEKHLMQTAAKKIQAHVETMRFQGQL